MCRGRMKVRYKEIRKSRRGIMIIWTKTVVPEVQREARMRVAWEVQNQREASAASWVSPEMGSLRQKRDAQPVRIRF